jgi:hypothetical protein
LLAGIATFVSCARSFLPSVATLAAFVVTLVLFVVTLALFVATFVLCIVTLALFVVALVPFVATLVPFVARFVLIIVTAVLFDRTAVAKVAPFANRLATTVPLLTTLAGLTRMFFPRLGLWESIQVARQLIGLALALALTKGNRVQQQTNHPSEESAGPQQARAPFPAEGSKVPSTGTGCLPYLQLTKGSGHGIRLLLRRL